MKIAHAILAATLFTCAAGSLRADATLKRYQQALRDQGFYYGPVDGTEGDETTQSIKRYQIRNGLAVTGVLDEETRHALDQGENAAQSTPPPLVAPTPTPRPSAPPPRPTAAPRSTPQASVRPDNDPNDRNAPPPPTRDDASDGNGRYAPSAPLTNYFGGTPFEFAPPPVQSDTIRQAQHRLNRSGFYDGPEDGRPSRELTDALSNYQEVRRLRRSGRLDSDTLIALRLMPDRRPGPPRRPPSDNGGVYDGRIVH